MSKRRTTWKDDVARDAARARRTELRAILAALRTSIRAARGARRDALERARAVCRQERARVRENVKALRVELLRGLRATLAAARAKAHDHCKGQFAAAARIQDQLERDRAHLRSELQYRAELRRIEAGNRKQRLEARGKGARAHERLVESDDQVVSNIPAELVPLWERVKGRMKDRPKKTRTEAFLEYAESHADEILRASEHEADRRLEELLEERDRRDRELSAVPF